MFSQLLSIHALPRILFVALLVLLVLIVFRKHLNKPPTKTGKRVATIFMLIMWLLVTGCYVWMRILDQNMQDWRINQALFSDKVEANNVATAAWIAINASINPISGPVIDRFFYATPINSPEPVPQLPEPYSNFTYLLSGYKANNIFYFNSPYLPETELPKTDIERSIERRQTPAQQDPRYVRNFRSIKLNDTIFFRGLVQDNDKRDNYLPQLIEPAIRYSQYGGYYYAIPRHEHTISRLGADARGLLVLHHGKIVYRNMPFDTAKMVKIFPFTDGKSVREFDICIYGKKESSSAKEEKAWSVFQYAEWRFYVYSLVGLAMVLRYFTVVEAIENWRKRRKGAKNSVNS